MTVTNLAKQIPVFLCMIDTWSTYKSKTSSQMYNTSQRSASNHCTPSVSHSSCLAHLQVEGLGSWRSWRKALKTLEGAFLNTQPPGEMELADWMTGASMPRSNKRSYHHIYTLRRVIPHHSQQSPPIKVANSRKSMDHHSLRPESWRKAVTWCTLKEIMSQKHGDQWPIIGR